jgi:hypothetical protein
VVRCAPISPWRPWLSSVDLAGRGTTAVWQCAGPPDAGTLVLLHGVAMIAELSGLGFLSGSAGSSALWRRICAAMATGSRFVAAGSVWRTVLRTSLRWPMCSTSNASPRWATR